MRQVVLDTETTGLEPAEDHRIIEIGCVELVERKLTGNDWHFYLNPEREIDEGALEIHGISAEFLADKPTFGDIVDDFLHYIDGAELVIHNASFDVGFLDYELARLERQMGTIEQRCSVLDTLQMARSRFPGQKNNQDALCRRFGIDHSHRELHGALLDAQLLAQVYLAMTGGQTRLSLGAERAAAGGNEQAEPIRRLAAGRTPLPVVPADASELDRHRRRLDAIGEQLGEPALWDRADS